MTVEQKLGSAKNNRLNIHIGEGHLELKTRIARYYFFNHDNSIGVIKFTKLIRNIWAAARKDDPYADLYLLKIYDGLISLRKDIQKKIHHYREYINKNVNFSWKLKLHDDPKKIILKFRHPYGFMAANLIAEFDEYACVIYSAKMIGVILDKPTTELLKQIGDKISAIFQLAALWKKTGITRKDIQNNTESYQQQKSILDCIGILNEQVLLGNLRLPHAPKIIKV